MNEIVSRVAGLFRRMTGSLANGVPAGQRNGMERSPVTGPRDGPTFAFVCLNSTRMPPETELKEHLAHWLGHDSEEAIEGFENTANDGKRVLSFKAGGRQFMVGLVGMPIPRADIEDACANSFLWPNAHDVISEHKVHLIVMALGNYETPVEKGLALSRVMAACSECYDAAGIYWGHARLVHEPMLFRDSIRKAGAEMRELPVLMWVGFTRTQHEDGSCDVYTRGLEAFSAMDIEVVRSEERPSEILKLLVGISAYLIHRGNVIRDGDTVGSGEKDTRIASRYANSVIGRRDKVLRVEC